MHYYNATIVHWHHTLGCQCSSFGTYDHKVVPIRLLSAEKLNYFTTSLRGKNKVEVKFENSMHNNNATLVHWHHTLGCQCSSFGTCGVHKVVPVRVLIAEKLNYFITSLQGKNEVEVKYENSMHNYNASLVHWHHTLGCQFSSFGTYAVHKVGPVKQSKPCWRTDGQTDGWTDGNHQSNIVGLVIRNPPKNRNVLKSDKKVFKKKKTEIDGHAPDNQSILSYLKSTAKNYSFLFWRKKPWIFSKRLNMPIL